MAQQSDYRSICSMTDRELITHLCSYTQWRELEKADSFRKLTLVETCECCGVDIGMTVTKDSSEKDTFAIEISAKGGLYTIFTKKRYNSDKDVVKERKQIDPKELEEPSHNEFCRTLEVQGTRIEDEWIALPYVPTQATLEARTLALRL